MGFPIVTDEGFVKFDCIFLFFIISLIKIIYKLSCIMKNMFLLNIMISKMSNKTS
jgi:hypothetical protein